MTSDGEQIVFCHAEDDLIKLCAWYFDGRRKDLSHESCPLTSTRRLCMLKLM